MQLWTSFGPYNAIDLIRLPGPPDIARWRDAVAGPMAQLDLEPPTTLGRYHGPCQNVITVELNKPFAPGEAPIRFFTAEEGEDGSHYFGATFDHWVADSPSFRFLTQRAFEHYAKPGAASLLPPMRVCTKSFHKLFGCANWPLAVLECLQTYIRHCRAYRIPVQNPMDFHSSFRHFQMPDGLIDRIRAFGKKSDATVNDVFLAAILQTMGKFTSGTRAKESCRFLLPKRDAIAFTTAVDIRPLASESLEDEFGCFLSYFSVLVQNPETRALADLVPQIAKITKSIKLKKEALRNFRSFKTGRLFWNFFRTPRQRAMMYHRAVPFLGGISNVNLTGTWIGHDRSILDYIRVSPTGPLVPVVFTLSTIRDRLALCFTYRDAVFTHGEASGIAQDFMARLNGI